MYTATLGYTRDNGEFEILATLSNLDGSLSEDDFKKLIQYNRDWLTLKTARFIEAFHRQDTPARIDISDEVNFYALP